MSIRLLFSTFPILLIYVPRYPFFTVAHSHYNPNESNLNTTLHIPLQFKLYFKAQGFTPTSAFSLPPKFKQSYLTKVFDKLASKYSMCG